MGFKLILGRNQKTPSGRQRKAGWSRATDSPCSALSISLLFSLARWTSGPCKFWPQLSSLQPYLLLLSPSARCSSRNVCLPVLFCFYKRTLALGPFHLLFSQLEMIFRLRKVIPWPLFKPLPLLIFLSSTSEMIDVRNDLLISCLPH